MKKTKLIITALLGFFINAASAETYSLGTKYASDYFFRGSLMTQESIQADLGVKWKSFWLGLFRECIYKSIGRIGSRYLYS